MCNIHVHACEKHRCVDMCDVDVNVIRHVVSSSVNFMHMHGPPDIGLYITRELIE